MSLQQAPRKRGRPPKNAPRADRPERIPVSGRRDILTVLNKDPDFQYRWVKDYNETGARIQQFLEATWSFVDGSIAQELRIGQQLVYSSEDQGSVIRRPDGRSGEFLYLMRIPKELYEEDQAAKENVLLESERDAAPNGVNSEGDYGSLSTDVTSQILIRKN